MGISFFFLFYGLMVGTAFGKYRQTLLHAAATLQQPSINIFRPGPTGGCLDGIAREMPNSVTKPRYLILMTRLTGKKYNKALNSSSLKRPKGLFPIKRDSLDQAAPDS
jgi:hypothetical protein